MKKNKILSLAFILGIIAVTLSSCSKCKGEDPSARVINNGTNKVSVQIKTSGGNTENINNVDPGTSSSYRSYAPGLITFTISVNNNSYEKSITMSECCDYDITIDKNNNITSISIDRND